MKTMKPKSKKAAKAATLTRPAHKIECVYDIIGSLPDKMLRDLARQHGTPIKKAKRDTANELCAKLLENKTPITIGIG